MMIIVFDTETTGLLAPIAAGVEHQPYLIDLSAIKLDENLNVIDRLSIRCKPPIDIPDGAIKIHGITNEMITLEKPFAAYFTLLAEFFKGSDISVGHNVLYDEMILWYELLRLGKTRRFPWPIRTIDTIETCIQYYGHRKNLQDLYNELFGEGFTGAHSSSIDCEMTKRCFVELVNMGRIEL